MRTIFFCISVFLLTSTSHAAECSQQLAAGATNPDWTVCAVARKSVAQLRERPSNNCSVSVGRDVAVKLGTCRPLQSGTWCAVSLNRQWGEIRYRDSRGKLLWCREDPETD
jgi:hypothetical protein